jgi:hypothetical protein
LIADGIGSTSEVTYYTAHVVRECSIAPGPEPDSDLTSLRVFTTPVEVSIMDVFMHESIWDEQLPEVKVYSHPIGRPVQALGPSDLLPVTEKAVYLGRGLDVARTPVIPRYPELLEYVLRRVGWKSQELRLFRCRANYPPLSALIAMRFSRRKGV